MSKELFLDTSVIIDFLRVKDKSASIFYKLISKNSKFLVSIVTHTELYSGKSVWESEKACQELKFIFEGIEVIGLTEKISVNAGQIRALYNLDLIDAIIASTAIVTNTPLVSLNTKHFSHVEDLELFDF
jgi:tRNA(fMet)-specific endonuclease VapC